MDIPQEVLVVGGVAVLGVVVLCVIFILQRRRVDFTGPKSAGQKPEWMHEMPPPETVAATQADGEGITLYDYDEGELVASAFAEQIEDIVRAHVSEDPALAGLDLDFGTGPDGGLEFLVDGQSYTDIGQIPNEHLRDVIHQAIESWNQR
jgi:hypothetical protein